MIALLCTAALAGDLWLDIEAKDADGTLLIHVPADDLAEGDSTVEMNGKTIDLAAEAKALKAAGKGKKTFDIPTDDGTPTVLTLSHQEPHKGPEPTELVMRIAGPMGMGMDLTFALDGSTDLGEVNGPLGGTVDIDGVDLSLSKEDLAVLRRAGPTDLVKVLGPKGGGLTISTR